MRRLLFGAAVIVGMGLGGLAPAMATPLAVSGRLAIAGLGSQSADAAVVEKIGWRRQLRRYGYPVPYAYYPPAYGYYAPPPAYAYAPPAYNFMRLRRLLLRVTIQRGRNTATIRRTASTRTASIPRTASMASIRPPRATDRSGEAVIDHGRTCRFSKLG